VELMERQTFLGWESTELDDVKTGDEQGSEAQ
jgi:hypothetical protein